MPVFTGLSDTLAGKILFPETRWAFHKKKGPDPHHVPVPQKIPEYARSQQPPHGDRPFPVHHWYVSPGIQDTCVREGAGLKKILGGQVLGGSAGLRWYRMIGGVFLPYAECRHPRGALPRQINN